MGFIMYKQHICSAAIASLLVLGLASGNASAAGGNMEQCFGVAKTGKNDCSSNKSAHVMYRTSH